MFHADTGSGSYPSQLLSGVQFYGPEGYVADVPSGDPDAAADWLAGLRAKQWLDSQTRAVFVEFTLYLAEQARRP